MGILVRQGGLLTTVQDLGRIGYQELGVPVSGVMDYRSAKLANILVNNEEAEALLEATVMGPTLSFTENCTISITGGNLSPQMNGIPLPMYRAVPCKAGDVLSFGAQKDGCRAYIAFAGGLEISPIMESCSTYLKAKMGGFHGRALQSGDEIPLKAAHHPVPHWEKRAITPEDFSAKNKTLRVVLGPQDDHFTEKGLHCFLHSTYAVTAQCDRMGYRLENASGEAIEHIGDGNIISDGITMGAIQVPQEGNPIILMADRQTTGGYAKIAHVITVDLPCVAQGKFGDTVCFEQVSVQEAQALYLEELQAFEELRRNADTGKIPTTVAANAIAPLSEYVITLEGKEYQVTVEALD